VRRRPILLRHVFKLPHRILQNGVSICAKGQHHSQHSAHAGDDYLFLQAPCTASFGICPHRTVFIAALWRLFQIGNIVPPLEKPGHFSGHMFKDVFHRLFPDP
jgi:hypothetical protein